VTARPIIFLDDGGVMNDNNARALQWQRLVGEYFVPLLGGSPEAWSRANRVVTDRLFEPDAWRRRVQAALPGVGDTIRALCRQGYMLHTASGESSLDLEGYLQAMGVRDCFGRLYGPDLIDTLKEGPEYYDRIFADLGIAAAEALVVDDSPRATRWATQVGARAALVGDSPLPQTGTTVHIGSLVELPATLQRLD
jgi:HAD superfamily hydrolase (TIGR01509 family)